MAETPVKRSLEEVAIDNEQPSMPPSKKTKLNSTPIDDTIHPNNPKKIPIQSHHRKRRVCLIASYLGTNYYGSSWIDDSSFPTIERAIFEAIVKAGAVSEANSESPKKISLSRASRTDKGVHAAAAAFSVQLINLFEPLLVETTTEVKETNESDTKSSKEKDDSNDKSKNESDKSESTLKPKKDKKSKEKKLSSDEKEEKIDEYQWPEMIDYLNSFLPNDVRIHGIQRTTKNFEPRYQASSRHYRYVCPTFLFDSAFQIATEMPLVKDGYDKFYFSSNRGTNNDDNNSNDPTSVVNSAVDSEKKVDSTINETIDSTIDESKENLKMDSEMNEIKAVQINCDNDRRHNYRLPNEKLIKLEKFCSIYTGVNNYHNFTKRTNPNDPSANRNIYNVSIITPSVIRNGIEFIEFGIHGQSFMYHQIRKMIGFLVCLMQGYTMNIDGKQGINPHFDTDTIIKAALSKQFKMAVPLAPSAGLYLLKVDFDRYNKKCQRHSQFWTEIHYSRYMDGIDNFISSSIRPQIMDKELNNDLKAGMVFSYWLYGVQNDFIFETIELTEKVLQSLVNKGHNFIPIGNRKSKALPAGKDQHKVPKIQKNGNNGVTDDCDWNDDPNSNKNSKTKGRGKYKKNKVKKTVSELLQSVKRDQAKEIAKKEQDQQ